MCAKLSNNPIIHYISTQYKPPTKTFRNANIRKSFRFRHEARTTYFRAGQDIRAGSEGLFFSTKASVAYFLLIFANAKKV